MARSGFRGRLGTRVAIVASAILAAGGIAVALPAAASLAGSSPCSTTSGADKCVAITGVNTQSLQVGTETNVTYTFQPNAGAPQVLGSLELSPSDGSGITFAGVTSTIAAANCSVSASGAAVCLDLNASPGQSFGVTIAVDTTCTAAGDNFSLLLSGASDFHNDKNGRGDAFAPDLPSVDNTMSYLQQTTEGSCAPAPTITRVLASPVGCPPQTIIVGTNFEDAGGNNIVTDVEIDGSSLPASSYTVADSGEILTGQVAAQSSVSVTTTGGTASTSSIGSINGCGG